MSDDIIAFTGRKGSGKDLCASMLTSNWTNIKFAEPLKGMARYLLEVQGLHPSMVERMSEGDLKEVETDFYCGKTPRYIQQTLGTEWGRKLIGEDIWVDITMKRALGFQSVVVTDARFENEEQALMNAGATLIRVVRPDLIDNEFSNHASETYIDKMKVHHEIINDGTIPKLLEKFKSVLMTAGFTMDSLNLKVPT